MSGDDHPIDRQAILALPLQKPVEGCTTIREYLVHLVAVLWEEGECFSGKRPFGNSGWDWDLLQPLVKANYIDGDLDEDGNIDHVDDEAGQRLIAYAITGL